jgi:hypothetical protein
MIDNIKESLEKQREELTNEIRSLENDILIAKEKYLKVQGALEILEIVQDNKDSVTPEVVEG